MNLQVTSRKEQAQCWYITEVPYGYVSVDMLCKTFNESPLVKRLEEELSEPYEKSQNHKSALSFSMYSLSKWQLFSACMTRALLLFRRQFSVYVIRTTQVTAFHPIPDNLRGRCSLHVIYGFRSKCIAHVPVSFFFCLSKFFFSCSLWSWHSSQWPHFGGLGWIIVLVIQILTCLCLSLFSFFLSTGFGDGSNYFKAPNFLQTERVVFLPSLGLCNASHRFESPVLFCASSGLDMPHLLSYRIHTWTSEVIHMLTNRFDLSDFHWVPFNCHF